MKLSAVQRFTVLDYPGKVACIAFTPGCNMRCGFCHNAEFVLPEKIRGIQDSFISEEAFFGFLEKRRGLLEGVVVSGGEPTIWRDLPAFCKRIQERGFLVKLDTNGNHPAMLTELLENGFVNYVAMDVKTSLEAYPSLTGPITRRENIQKSIKLLKESRVAHEFRTTLIKEHHTESVLEGMKQMLAGAEQLFLQTFRPAQTLSPVFGGYHAFSPAEMEDIACQFRLTVSQVFLR
jgi:pyruvate formate lyase activating enzyme